MARQAKRCRIWRRFARLQGLKGNRQFGGGPRGAAGPLRGAMPRGYFVALRHGGVPRAVQFLRAHVTGE
jgi:hypothetical protein